MPILVGYMMDAFGPGSFMMAIAVTMGLVSCYGFYRMTARASTPVDETLPATPLSMVTTSVAAEFAQEWSAEQASATDEDDATWETEEKRV